MFILNFIIGSIFIAAGAALIVYAYPLNKKVFFLSWIEKKYGQGSGPSAYKLFGLIAIILGVCSIVGWIDIAKPLLASFQTNQPSLPQEATTNITNTVQNGDIAP